MRGELRKLRRLAVRRLAADPEQADEAMLLDAINPVAVKRMVEERLDLAELEQAFEELSQEFWDAIEPGQH